MKAAIRKKYGSPSVITVEEVARPVPANAEVLIKVKATTVNRTDCANLTAKPFIMRFVLGFLKPQKPILGTDFAGDIVEVGKGVMHFKRGDKVFGFFDTGLESQAEYMVLKHDGNMLTIPDGVDYKNAAASVEGGHYAYSFIHKVEIRSGQKVFINGATGGIGSTLMQFVRQFDVHITATANTPNIDLIKSLGADKVIDYTKDDFTKLPATYDYIFDAVGKSTFGKCKSLLTENGVYISSELGPFAQNVFFAIRSAITGKKKVVFPVPFPIKQTLPFIQNQLATKKLKPVIDRKYNINDIAKAYEYVMQGKKTGSVIVHIKSSYKKLKTF